MKSLSLKVMTLLMAALILSASGCMATFVVLSASGCFNDEMSSPEGTVKGFYKALNQYNYKKMLDYTDPREVSKDDRQAAFLLARAMRKSEFKITLTDVKTTLVSDKLGKAWKGDKWHPQKQATVEVRYKRTIPTDKAIMFDNRQDTVKLVKLDNKWYIEDMGRFYL
jgi:hypothetical protein